MIPTTENSIQIREITTVAEMRAVEEMQKEVWGVPDIEVVPASHLMAAVAAGGVLIGAFDSDQLVGFVYGFVSFERGQTAHHSHMLAVKPEYRNYKLGEKLKLAQRDAVVKQGIKLISWTFDPLQSLNAYFNFSKLGVVSCTYFIDFYGDDAPSFLHQNSTDRLWVFWDVAGTKKAPEADIDNVLRLVRFGEDAMPQIGSVGWQSDQLAIEIPANINQLQTENIQLAAEWRQVTRDAFISAFEKGYVAAGFYRKECNGQDYGIYLLSKKKG